MEELGLLDAAWLSLDQWEVARDHVVLNRKLGEGAFGTVYGGEALINEAWVAVAVKTLKIGSSPEEKVRRGIYRNDRTADSKLFARQMDFLGEAEMMKRFDHDNIIKLLGVCTRGEPAYMIMEFMLHGMYSTMYSFAIS
jgi:serine/threonine protein kinase